MANRNLTPVKSHMILTTANHHLQLYKRSLEGFGEHPQIFALEKSTNQKQTLLEKFPYFTVRRLFHLIMPRRSSGGLFPLSDLLLVCVVLFLGV